MRKKIKKGSFVDGGGILMVSSGSMCKNRVEKNGEGRKKKKKSFILNGPNFRSFLPFAQWPVPNQSETMERNWVVLFLYSMDKSFGTERRGNSGILSQIFVRA